jgi:hypothetical protein
MRIATGKIEYVIQSGEPDAARGSSALLEGGALTIRNRFTYYPQKQEIYRFFKGELAIPSPEIGTPRFRSCLCRPSKPNSD